MSKRPLVPVLIPPLALLAAAACESKPPEPPARSAAAEPRNDRVRDLFDSMAKGTYTEALFPKLGWEDIPALLERAASTKVLTNFPCSPDSSQSEEFCSEGMVALWLVEGVRKGGGFASLNALCFGPADAKATWGERSEANHERVRAAYAAWWTRARGLTREQAVALDPLEGTGLHWY